MKRFTNIAVMALAAVAMNAATLTPEQALSRVLADSDGPAKAPSAYTLVATRTAEQQPAVYVFNTPGQFLIASAEDGVRPCLGYGDGVIDPANLPCNFAAWLDGYAEEIAAYRAMNAGRPAVMSVTSPSARVASRAAIAPLCETLWDQGAPYNNLCPTVSGRRAPTGCAATALAQVMKKHNYPAQGSGTNTYLSNGTTITADLSQSTYDWNNMIATYYSASSGTEAQRTAVAQLMYDCGVSLNMQYGATESGAFDFMPTYSLTKYFGYDADNMLEIYRAGFLEQDEWDDQIYESLAGGMPVFYTGQATNGGHSFVCDGYSSNSNFHINWGWGGYCDGYFPLSALNPSGQGTGGYEGGYNSNQSAVIGVRPTPAGETRRIHHHMVGSGAFTWNGWSFAISSYVAAFCLEPTDFQLGLKVIDGRGNVQYFLNDYVYHLNAYDRSANDWWLTNPRYQAPIKDLAPGTYRVYPAVKVEGGQPHVLPFDKSTNPMLYLTVDNMNNYEYSQMAPEVNAALSLVSFEPSDGVPAQPGHQARYTLTLSNAGPEDYNGIVYISIDSELSYSNSVVVELNIPNGSTATQEFDLTAQTGVHTVRVANSSLVEIAGSPYEFVIGGDEAVVVAESIAPTAVVYNNSEVAYDVTVRNAGAKDFSGNVWIALYSAGGDGAGMLDENISVAAGQTYTWTTAKMNLNDVEPGQYFAVLLSSDKELTSDYRSYFEILERPSLRLSSVTPLSGLSDGTIRLEIIVFNDAESDYDNDIDIVAYNSGNAPAWSTQKELKVAPGNRQRLMLQDVELGSGTYTLEITDISGAAIAGSGMAFTVKGASIDGVDAADNVKVTAADGCIVVTGAEAGEYVTVSSVTGATVAATVAGADGSVRFSPSAVRGVYLVTVGRTTFKVAL